MIILPNTLMATPERNYCFIPGVKGDGHLSGEIPWSQLSLRGNHVVSHFVGSLCSKYGFYLIMSEGIIDLHHILFYLYKCHEQTCCHGSAWAYVMTADNHVFRGSPLIGAARQRFPPGELVWAASWPIELGRRFQRERRCFVMLRYIENSLCKL